MEAKAKRILFVLPTAEIGGTRTSLLNLLSHMDKERYQIDVMFLLHRGPMVEQFKKYGNVLPQDKNLLAGRESAVTLLKAGKLGCLLKNVGFIISSKLKKASRYELAYERAAKNYDGKYDCVIAFQEKDTTDFARYIKTERKLAWVHTDFSRTIKGQGEEHFSKTSNCFDKVIFVSDACMNVFKESAHIEQGKMTRVYNTFDSDAIIKKSTEYKVEKQENVPVFVSVGRFCEPKRFERVVEAAYRLKTEGYNFKWYLIGDGELYSQIEQGVKEKGIEDCLVLTGRKANPYPYVLAADAMVITSAMESHPMVANEAFILSTPVVSTAFPSAAEVVTDGHNGLLCENSAEGVYLGVKQALDNPMLLEGFKNNLEGFKYDNGAIVKQVEDLIEGREFVLI